ncbi:MAG: T9SS type A sorting domain-containing protein, partial [Flavobacteriales bacterium]|nr:T9SS type A sorting domain-containing protein [Flavobacteriales bacterium]
YINSEAEISFVQWNTDATAGTYIYPFGFSGSYIPFTFAKNAATATNVSVSTWTTSVDNQTNIPTGVTLNATDGTDKFIDRWWDVDPSVTLSATLTFSWTTSETSGVDYTTTPISFHWNGTSFDEITATAGTENITSTWTSYSHGGGGGGGAPLPIDLISFDAKYNKNTADVDLTWVTASETNNDYFTIEKSQDATDFDIVVTEPGAGNSNVILTYKTIDPAPYLNTSFYRLKQTDYDGQYKYSNMVAVKITPKEKLRIWPNPVADILSISFASEATTASVKEESGYTISIYDTQGQLVKRGNHDSDKSELKINVSELSEGLYVLEISREGQIHKVQFTKAPN